MRRTLPGAAHPSGAFEFAPPTPCLCEVGKESAGSTHRLQFRSARHRVQRSGFRTESDGKRLKSRSAVQNSATPCVWHTAAILPSCTIGPITLPASSWPFNVSQCEFDSASNVVTGDSSQASICATACSVVDGGAYIRGWVTMARNSCTQGQGSPQSTLPVARASILAHAWACHSESLRCAYTKMFVSVAINRLALRRPLP